MIFLIFQASINLLYFLGKPNNILRNVFSLAKSHLTEVEFAEIRYDYVA